MATEQGYPDAQFNLGMLYHLGNGVDHNEQEAVYWYHLAAQWGCSQAQANLSEHYRTGIGVDQDEAVAARWCRFAAEQGVVDAQLNLGLRCARGIGVETDPVLAYFWLSLAVGGGSAEASEYLASVAQVLTSEQVVELQRLAHEWKRRTPTESALGALDAEIVQVHECITNSPSGILPADAQALLDRIDDLIDVGIVLGSGAEDHVESLRKIHQALAVELDKAVPEARELRARMSSLREVQRAPGLRQWLSRPKASTKRQ
jgi:hypothetical protein